jgi:glucose-1-phosphate cytidylyltransferase
MVQIGYRPILWHIMKYYAHFGHKDFILCLGWKANVIKEYFLNYDECISNDFVLSSGGGEINLLNTDIQDWNITFVDTGTTSTIGERLKAVEEHLRDEEVFFANYADGLTDCYLPDLVDFFYEKDTIGAFLSVQPEHNSFHAVKTDETGLVRNVKPIDKINVWMNGGYFVFTPEIFDYIEKGQELVEEPFERLIEENKLHSYKHDGFWGCMDTFKEKEILDQMFATGKAPWEIWKHSSEAPEFRVGADRLLRPVSFPVSEVPIRRQTRPVPLKKH